MEQVKYTTPMTTKPLKKPVKRKPTIKQKRAIDNLVANGGNVATAMRDAGYSEAMARNPQKLTQSDYMQQLFVEAGLHDIDGIKLLKDGMASTKTIVMGKEEDSFVDIQPDYAVRHKYLETFIKIKGWSQQPEGGGVNVNFINVSKGDQGEYGL